jgi:RimJ/RimL family protein N-acetyltransferase
VIKLRPAKQEDVEYLRTVALEGGMKTYPPVTVEQPAYTGYVNDKPIGCGGVVILWDGVGEVWLIVSREVESHKVQAVKVLKRMCEIILLKHELRRIQAIIRTDFPQAVKLVESLGFEREGTLRNYCPDGQDSYMYARLK